MVEMGMDLIEVKDFLEDKCIHEENPELLLDNLDNPQFINALRQRIIQHWKKPAAYKPKQNLSH